MDAKPVRRLRTDQADGDGHVRSEGICRRPRRLDNAVAYDVIVTQTDALVYLGALSDYPELSKAALEELAVYVKTY